MFAMTEIHAAEAAEAEANCGDAERHNCNFWLPTSWCGGPDHDVNRHGN